MRANMGCGASSWGEIRIDKDPSSSAATHIMDLEDLSFFEDQCFDDVRCISVLEHIQNWRKALLEMLRVTRGRIILEVPINSNIIHTDAWRILFPSKENLKLFLSIPRRARETLWQMDPWILWKIILDQGFQVNVEKIFQLYAGVPSRCWRITAWRIQK